MTKNVLTHPGGTIKSSAGSAAIGAAGGLPIFAVPAGKVAEILQITTDTTMSATVGNRSMYIWITSALGSNMWLGQASANTPASQVCGYDVGFGSPLNTPSTSVRRNIAQTANTNIQVRENSCLKLLAANSGIAIDDINNIDVADVVTFRIHYIEYEA